MKPSERLLEISRRRYEQAGNLADWKPEPAYVGSCDILEYLDESSREAGRAGEGGPTVEEWEALELAIDIAFRAHPPSAKLAREAFRKLNAASALRTAGRGKDSTESQPATGDGTGEDDVREFFDRWLSGYFDNDWGGLDEDELEDVLGAFRFARDRGIDYCADDVAGSHRDAMEQRRLVEELKEKLSAAETLLEKAREQIAMRGDSEVQRRLTDLSCATLDEVAPMLEAARKRAEKAESAREEAERKVVEHCCASDMPQIEPPAYDSTGGDWRWSAEWLRGELAVAVPESPELPRLITVSGHRNHTAEEARWLGAALLAAAEKIEPEWEKQ